MQKSLILALMLPNTLVIHVIVSFQSTERIFKLEDFRHGTLPTYGKQFSIKFRCWQDDGQLLRSTVSASLALLACIYCGGLSRG
ncbi:hypothetical protein HYPSUDRAFT_812769 [Hypholoma sublateritium FD-334 SS-4]|uniref:Uncharacterized protein n=1 Tax=Hypholoma sublateritium (strain FD-334 SS-4) TaxID=945553 RepID=A0A0D2MAM5_HYPSF|nr:hypothetical protein HYPSUDRAFT_812769 [Hypholoma sublateritium FD-334 SS-4]